MPLIITYLIKLSVCLSVVFLFYRLVLRKLTFYNWNRWYLLGYTLLSFYIPFINISPVLEKNEWTNSEVINWVPVIGTAASNQPGITAGSAQPVNSWDIILLFIIAGVLFMLVRLVIQLLSFRKMMKKATLVSKQGLNIYQVNDNIIPFSFGNSIFINRELHPATELQEIIRHEFVHVKQQHSLDIIWGEILCLFNWYNPFAWLLKKAIRQNLEFIADHQVLEHGVDKKQYQYLLLKVIGNNHFSIANQFNFSSLKKRIAMMNKIKSARRNLVRFLFLLPVLAIVLLAFRNRYSTHEKQPLIRYAAMVTDLETKQPLPGVKVLNINTAQEATTDENGYFVMEIPADKMVHVKMRYNKPGYSELMTSAFSLERKDNTESFSIMEIVSIRKGNATDPCVGCSGSVSLREEKNPAVGFEEVKGYYDQLLYQFFTDTVPEQRHPNKKGYYIDIRNNDGNCLVVIKDKNRKEVKRLLMIEWNEKSDYYENLYGKVPPPPVASLPTEGQWDEAANPDVRSITVNNEKAIVVLKTGKKEEYNLADPKQKKDFEDKYDLPEPPAPPLAPTNLEELDAPLPPLPPKSPTGVKHPAAPPVPPKPPKAPKPGSTTMIITADTLIWTGDKGSLTLKGSLKGNASLQTGAPDYVTISADAIELKNNPPLVMINGKEADLSKDFTAGKKARMKVISLDKDEAVKKYGNKGENGAIEISTLSEAAAPKQPVQPSFLFNPYQYKTKEQKEKEKQGDGC